MNGLTQQIFTAIGQNMSLQAAAASFIFVSHFVQEYETKIKTLVANALCRSRTVYSNVSLLVDLKFQDISGQYENFIYMAPADFEFLINSIGPKIAKKNSTYTAAIPAEERLLFTLRSLATGDSYTSLQYLSKISEQEVNQIIVCKLLLRH
jgi:hypothetical protein